MVNMEHHALNDFIFILKSFEAEGTLFDYFSFRLTLVYFQEIAVSESILSFKIASSISLI